MQKSGALTCGLKKPRWVRVVQDWPRLGIEFKASLGYMRLSQKIKNKSKKLVKDPKSEVKKTQMYESMQNYEKGVSLHVSPKCQASTHLPELPKSNH